MTQLEAMKRSLDELKVSFEYIEAYIPKEQFSRLVIVTESLLQAIEQAEKDQTSCYCPNCEALSKQLEQTQSEANKRSEVEPVALEQSEEREFWLSVVEGLHKTFNSPTQGMTLGQRIEHVGGRTNAAGYIEFGSAMAVKALIDHVLRDTTPPKRRPLKSLRDMTEADFPKPTALQEKRNEY